MRLIKRIPARPVLDDRDAVRAGPWAGDPGRQPGLVDAADGVDAACPLGQVVGEDRDYLAKPQSHDGEVVAAQPQRGEPEQHAEAGGHEHPQEQHDPEGQVEVVVKRRRTQLGRREQRVRVRADGKEGCVAKVEETGKPDHDVEPDGQQDPGAGMGRLGDVGGAASAYKQADHREQQRREEEDAVDRLVAVPDPLPQVQPGHQRPPLDDDRLGHFSGTLIPRSPVGRNTSTAIRMPKIMTSVHFEPM